METDNIGKTKPENEKEIVDTDIFSIFNAPVVNDKYLKDQYGLTALNVLQAWDYSKGKDVVVSVIDSGVDIKHDDLENRVVSGYDVISSVPSFLGLRPYRKMSGTSMASPHVAGVAALIKSKFKNATPDFIKKRLENKSTDLGAPGRDDLYGHGLVNALKVVQED